MVGNKNWFVVSADRFRTVKDTHFQFFNICVYCNNLYAELQYFFNVNFRRRTT